jgi:superfamily I DNA/RNA helicase
MLTCKRLQTELWTSKERIADGIDAIVMGKRHGARKHSKKSGFGEDVGFSERGASSFHGAKDSAGRRTNCWKGFRFFRKHNVIQLKKGIPMRTLADIIPTGEQLKIVSRNRPGVEVIRGAAGSGKTTTALLRLTSLIGMTESRKRREGDDTPVSVLVLTFNRTLRGYINDLAHNTALRGARNLSLNISTFGKFAKDTLNANNILDDDFRQNLIINLGQRIPLDPKFLAKEIDYVLGRFLPEDLVGYLTTKREGRGTSPRLPQPLRQDIINDVILPYAAWKQSNNKVDWFDMEVTLAKNKFYNFDIIITDEAQDFSANQLRAIKLQAANIHAITFVVDTAQRIYARGFTWQECGFLIRPENVHRLQTNYRNTAQISQFALSLLHGIDLDDDATIPNSLSCPRQGPLPKVLAGRFSNQLRYAINFIKSHVNLASESVAFLLPLGGGWFDEIKRQLINNGLDYVVITKNSDWPQGPENIALSTIHSSKGLEFDHVITIGISYINCPHGQGQDDDNLALLRRLLAVGISRAKSSVLLGYNPLEKSDLMDYFSPGTFEAINV